MDVQSVLLDKNIFTKQEAKKWIKEHNFKTSHKNRNGTIKKVELVGNYYHFRQKDKKKDAIYRTKKIEKGVLLTLIKS